MFEVILRCLLCGWNVKGIETAENFDDGEDSMGYAAVEHASQYHEYDAL